MINAKKEEEKKETINLGPNDDGELMFNARAHTQIYTLKTASFDSQTDWLRNQAYQIKTETENSLKQKRKKWK